MPYQDLDTSLSPTEMGTLTTAFTDINLILKDKVVNLNIDERSRLYKMHNTRHTLALRILDHATNRPDLVPNYANLAGAKKDFEYYNQLITLINITGSLLEALNDTQMAVGSEVMQFCRQFYGSVKMAAEQNVPGTNSILDDIKVFYDLPSRPEDDNPPTE